MATPIDRTELFKKYPGKWVALAEDDTTVIASGATARKRATLRLRKLMRGTFSCEYPRR